MKTTIERIFETLSKGKVELASEKIKLSATQDMAKVVADMNTHYKKLVSSEKLLNAKLKDINKAKKTTDKSKKDAFKTIDQYDRIRRRFLKARKETEKIAKELGVKPSSIKELNEAYSIFEKLDKEVNKLDDKFTKRKFI